MNETLYRLQISKTPKPKLTEFAFITAVKVLKVSYGLSDVALLLKFSIFQK